MHALARLDPRPLAPHPLRGLLLLLTLLTAILTGCGTSPSVPAGTIVPTTAVATTLPAISPTALPPTADPPTQAEARPALTATEVPPTAGATAPAAIATSGAALTVPVLAYHHFGVPAAGDYDCPLGKFEQHLKWLKQNGYQSVLPQQVVDAMHGQATLPPQPIVFTFDDNNAEQYTDAAPLLEKYGYRGAFFVMSVTINKRYYMKATQLRDLERRGHVIGGHSWDHRDMAVLSPHELKKQLDLSEDNLSEVLGHKPAFVSYPFGAYNDDVVAELKERGYNGAFRLRNPDDPKVDPAFMMHRQIIPGAWSMADFEQNVHWMEP